MNKPDYKTKKDWLEKYNEHWRGVYSNQGLIYSPMKYSTFQQYMWEAKDSVPRTETTGDGVRIDMEKYPVEKFTPPKYHKRFSGTLGEGEDPDQIFTHRREYILDLLDSVKCCDADFIAKKLALYEDYNATTFKSYLKKLLPFMVDSGDIKLVLDNGKLKYKIV